MEHIIKKYSNLVYNLAYAKTQNAEHADDIFQEVFLRYIKTKPIFNDNEHEKAWFIRVTINCSKSFFSSWWQKTQ